MGLRSRFRSKLETIMEDPGMEDYRDVTEVENNKEKCGDDSLRRIAGEGNPRCGGEVNFADASHLRCNDLVENKLHETTENSSSFDDDVSGPESDSAFSDDEVVSDFQYDATYFQDELFRMRKKRLTDHWMTYVHPLMWRCKWLELQIRKLNWLEHRFTRDLAKCNQNERQQVENCPPNHKRDKVIKRKRRKRIEDTVDIGTYMSEHAIFSHYEKKKVPAHGVSSYEERKNIVFKFDDELALREDLISLQPRDGDENMELVFHKMWNLMEHVSKLKSRVDKVMSDIAGEVSHADPKSTLLPCNALTSSARDPAPPSNNRDRVRSSHNVSQLLSEFNMGGVALSENAMMSLGEFEDDILIYNDRMYNGMNGFEDFNVQPAKKPQGAGKEYPRTTGPPVLKEEKETLTDNPPAQKTRSISQITASGTRKSQRGRVPRRLS